jgi:small GTP-binding protein
MGGCTGKEKAPAPNQNDETYHHIFKIVILGDVSVGKSCILLRYLQNVFTDTVATIGEDLQDRIVTVDKTRIKLQFSDTAGAERYRQITLSYYSAASAAIIVFDITKRSSFETVKNWKEDVEVNVKNKNKDPPIFIVVGNKSDLAAERQVTTEEAQALASSLGMDYYETSAKDGVGINEMIEQLSSALLQRQTNDDDA